MLRELDADKIEVKVLSLLKLWLNGIRLSIGKSWSRERLITSII